MGRKAVAARVKKDLGDGSVLYAYRAAPGTKEIYGKGPAGADNLRRFQVHVESCWNDHVEPQSPLEYLGSDISVPSKKRTPTLREWIGHPKKGEPGAFFDFGEPKLRGSQEGYEAQFTNHGAFEIIGDVPMRQVTDDMAKRVAERVLRCASCSERALAAGVDLSDAAARADRTPFDENCEQHWPARLRKRSSVELYFTYLAAAWNAAIEARLVQANPFDRMRIGRWEEPTSNDDLRVALTIDQFNRHTRAHNPEDQIIPILSAFAMLRMSEMWGLMRKDFPVPAEDPEDDPTTIRMKLARVYVRKEKRYRNFGKTEKSAGTGVEIELNEWATQAVFRHLRQYMPPSKECAACQSGESIWRGKVGLNPHRGCGLANDASLVRPELLDGYDYTKTVSPKAQRDAGLEGLGFEITHRSYRSTGATMLLHSGVEMVIVAQMGRWTNTETLLKHYHRLYPEAQTQAHNKLTRRLNHELGVEMLADASVDERLAFSHTQLTHLTRERDELAAEVHELRRHVSEAERLASEGRLQLNGDVAPRSKSQPLNDFELIEIMTSGLSQCAILRKLGRAPGGKTYEWLQREAERLDVILPSRQKHMRRTRITQHEGVAVAM